MKERRIIHHNLSIAFSIVFLPPKSPSTTCIPVIPVLPSIPFLGPKAEPQAETKYNFPYLNKIDSVICLSSMFKHCIKETTN